VANYLPSFGVLLHKMLKFLARNPQNKSTIQNIVGGQEEKTQKFERLLKIRKILGQADKTDPSYTPLPQKVQAVPVKDSELGKWLTATEHFIIAKSIVLDVVRDIQDNDPVFVVQSVLDGMITRLELLEMQQLKKATNSTLKRSMLFRKKSKTWKERAIIMHFFLHNLLGGMDLNLTSKAFGTPPTTIHTWYREKVYWGKWMAFIEEFSVLFRAKQLSNCDCNAHDMYPFFLLNEV
jgi:hypothetical protein